MNRRQLRGGLPLFPECYQAKTVREGNDTLCGGLHKDSKSFFLSDYDVIDMCRKCKAWHENYITDAKGARMETIEDIVREMRQSYGSVMRKYADRIEAAIAYNRQGEVMAETARRNVRL